MSTEQGLFVAVTRMIHIDPFEDICFHSSKTYHTRSWLEIHKIQPRALGSCSAVARQFSSYWTQVNERANVCPVRIECISIRRSPDRRKHCGNIHSRQPPRPVSTWIPLTSPSSATLRLPSPQRQLGPAICLHKSTRPPRGARLGVSHQQRPLLGYDVTCLSRPHAGREQASPQR